VGAVCGEAWPDWWPWSLLALAAPSASAPECAAEDKTGYPTPAELLEYLGKSAPGSLGAVVALATPSDTPAGKAVGYFRDGAQHAATVVVSASGRRLFVELEGDVLHTNVARYLYGGLD
jgi:hypothetical protein